MQKIFFPALASLAFAACAVDAPTDAQHCVSQPDGSSECYATFTEAIRAATHGEIADAPADARAALADDAFAARIEAYDARARAHGPVTNADGTSELTVLIGIVYKDANYGGGTWAFNQTAGCDGNVATVDFSVSNLNQSPYSDYGFNDNISSFRSYSSCQTVLYEDWLFGGSSTGAPVAQMSYVGSTFNDRASSIRWY